MFEMEFVDPIDMHDEDEEEIIRLIQAMIEEENQAKSIKMNPSKRVKEPPIVINLCGAKYESEE